MAPPTGATTQLLLSPAELSYLHTSLSLTPPIRPDARSSTQFRPLIAECGILPGTNGSARICFADGTEAVVGIKAEVEKSAAPYYGYPYQGREARLDLGPGEAEAAEGGVAGQQGGNAAEEERRGDSAWVELTVEIPGFRSDDAMPVFLAALLNEALLADRELTRRLWINRRFHWKLYIDILLLSPPLSYPLPLLSLTTHLALLSTRLPRLKSELDEDPLFDDDWDASVFLYPRSKTSKAHARPPVTLLVMAVQGNIIFDPSKEELSVAELVLAVSVAEKSSGAEDSGHGEAMDVDAKPSRDIKLLSVRTIDPPSRLTPPGIPNFLNTATGGSAPTLPQRTEVAETEGVWQPPRGGAKRKTIATMIQKVIEKGGVAEEVLDGLDAVDLG